jgi:hypothetical protein
VGDTATRLKQRRARADPRRLASPAIQHPSDERRLSERFSVAPVRGENITGGKSGMTKWLVRKYGCEGTYARKQKRRLPKEAAFYVMHRKRR